MEDTCVIDATFAQRNYRATVIAAVILKLRDADRELIKGMAEQLHELSK